MRTPSAGRTSSTCPPPPRTTSRRPCPTRPSTSSTSARRTTPRARCFPARPCKDGSTYANATDAVILFDAAYERFIADPAIPHSIYEIPGAKTCAIEFRSFSKTAGFTGARCGYTVVPRDLVREGQSLNAMWNRRQTTKFNGASYVIQRGAAAIYTPEGAAQVDETIDFYRANARTIKEGLAAAGLEVYGADNSPYVWCRTPNGTGSWDFFNRLLEEANVITTPGAGFGPAGEGYIRLTAFGDAGRHAARPSSASSGCSMPRVATSRSAPRNRRSVEPARRLLTLVNKRSTIDRR